MEEGLSNDQSNFLDLIPQLIFEIDKDFNIKFLNQSYKNILGYSKKELQQKNITIDSLFIPDDLTRIKKSIQSNFDGIKVSGNQYTVYDKNKEELILEIKKCCVKQNGSPETLKCIATKISDKNKENNFRQAFDNFPIPYQSLDKIGIINDVNPEWINRLGYSKNEAIGKNFKSFISGKDKKNFDNVYAQYIQEGEIKNTPVNLITKEGKIIPVNYNGKVEFTTDGKFICTHCVFNDITQQQQVEKNLKESEQKFRELNSTKDKFFSIIAHDLKNPFNDLMGFTQLLGINIDNYDKSKIKQFVDIIHQSSKLAYNLLENLLNWSRSQTGTLKFQPEKIWVNEIINENIHLLESTAIKKNIQIYSELDKDIYAFADKNMVRTIIRNLISNAIKYTNQGGYINISCYCSRKSCKVSIKDNGIGIEKENLDKIFKIEEGFSTVGTEREKGTGLGLILCKEFIKKNGGKIWVESEPNKGSAFTFALPLPEPEFFESEI